MCNRIFGYMPGYGPKGRVNKQRPVTLESTPQEVVDTLLDIIQPKATETLYDLGCGDGRILISATKKFGCRSVGVEIDKQTAELASCKAKEVNLDLGQIEIMIIEGDIKDQDLNGADIVIMYLFPETMKTVRFNSLKQGARVVSINHEIPGVNTQKQEVTVNGKKHTFYTHTVPYRRIQQ